GEQIYVARLAVHRRRADRIAVVNDVAEKVVEAMFPKFLSALGFETNQHFLQVGSFAIVAPGVQFAIGDDRRAASRKLVRPEMVLAADLPLVGQMRLRRSSVLLRPTPVEPTVDARGALRVERGSEKC